MSKSGTDTRPHLNRRRWPQLWNRVSLMLPELLHMVVKFLLERCFQIPPWHLVCGNSLQAKKSVNLKKNCFSFLSSSRPPTTLVPFTIVLSF